MRRAIIALVLMATVAAAADPQPVWTIPADHTLAIMLPDEILTAPTVARQLESGLTTIFLLSLRSGQQRSAARLEIRYDMWDEVWLVRRIEFDGRIDAQRVSRDALSKWWHAPTRLLAAAADRMPLDVTVTVLPFSAAEEADARDWIAKSGAVAVAASGPNGIVDALIGTTINARPLTTYRWKSELRLK